MSAIQRFLQRLFSRLSVSDQLALKQAEKEKSSRMKEYRLIRAFLWLFAFVFLVILFLPAHLITGTYDSQELKVAEFKKEIISLVIAAFGPWIGAGVAYFFGRENLREAYQGMKDARRKSPDEILRSTPVKDLPPKGLRLIVNPETEFKEVSNRIWAERSRWFFTYVDENGKFVAAIGEEEIWRIRANPERVTESLEQLINHFNPENDVKIAGRLDEIPMKFVLIYAAHQKRVLSAQGGADLNDDALMERVSAALVRNDGEDIIKSLNMAELFKVEDSAFVAEKILNQKRRYIGIVTDDQDKPVGYFTTGDIRRALTGSELNTI